MELWDAETGALLVTLEGHISTVSSCAFSPDCARVATTSRDSTTRLWDASFWGGRVIWGGWRGVKLTRRVSWTSRGGSGKKGLGSSSIDNECPRVPRAKSRVVLRIY
ncbi:hypothetical protein M885DRAFT_606912 [Pelagophyceae sp. CCMP2097]|nr:hypothetical protein M885DRAFT_606912 [Pelagophyceae sp. CCMP2097]